MAVIGVAVVGEIDGNDTGQVRGRMRGNLKRRKAAIGYAHHIDMAIAPWLLREPLHGVIAIQLFLERIFVGAAPFRRSRTPDVDPGDDIALARQEEIEGSCIQIHIVLAIGSVFHDNRPPICTMPASRHVQISGQARAVAHRDEDVLDQSDAIGNGLHRGFPHVGLDYSRLDTAKLSACTPQKGAIATTSSVEPRAAKRPFSCPSSGARPSL